MDINLSVIVMGEYQWDFLLEAIASIERCLDVKDEILIITSPILSPDEAEILTYLEGQGYNICRFSEPFNWGKALDFSISQSQGKYIFPLEIDQTINSSGLISALEILENNIQIGAVYGKLDSVGENCDLQSLIHAKLDEISPNFFRDYTPIFRKKAWEDCGGLALDGFNQMDWKFNFFLNLKATGWKFDCLDPVLLSPTIPSFQQDFQSNLNPSLNQINFKSSVSLSIQENSLVSVCIPTYNGEGFIAEAIASILSQTYSPLEIIISDDSSTDETLKIAQAFKERTSLKVSIFPHQRLGLAENCNFAGSKAKGKYIKFLFQDDLLAPNCIAEMVKVAEQDDDIGLVFSPREICFIDQVAETDPDLISIYQEFQHLHQAWSNLQPLQHGEELLSDPQLFKHPINKIGEPSTVLIRREILEKIGGFDPELNQLVDLDLWLRIMGTCKVGFVNQVLSYFRLHTQQKTYQNISENLATDLKFYSKVYAHPAYHFFPQSVREQALYIYTLNLNHFYLYFSDNSSGTFLEDLRQLRREVAEYWLKLPETECDEKPSNFLKIVYRILRRNKRLKAEPLTKSEQLFVQEMIEEITSLSVPFLRKGLVLSLMLYPHSTQLPVLSDPKM